MTEIPLSARYLIIRQSIKEKPSQEEIDALLESTARVEIRLLAELNKKSDQFKNAVREITPIKLGDIDITIPVCIQLNLDNIADANIEAASQRSEIDFVVNYDFFTGSKLVTAPIPIARMSERKLVTSKFKIRELMDDAVGVSLSGPSMDDAKIYQEILTKDPTGFVLVDFMLDYLRRLHSTEPFEFMANEQSAVLRLKGAEFANRAYKAFHRAFTS